MTLPARPGRQIGRALGLVAIVVVLLACNVAFFVHALHAPAALPHDASADAMLRSASTYLVLATALFVCLLAAAFDLVRLIRRMLATLDAMADTAGRIVAAIRRRARFPATAALPTCRASSNTSMLWLSQ